KMAGYLVIKSISFKILSLNLITGDHSKLIFLSIIIACTFAFSTAERMGISSFSKNGRISGNQINKF
ncbi:hypothetical protein, partial [Chryseobacterium sp. CH1]|uniref:hypothetical protein n=1 Tax=Chryseobacterium sp. CH1 TaxID=713551 RepID=UPI0010285C71